MKAIPILNNKSRRRLDGSTPNDVQAAVESDNPKDKVLHFKILKANAEWLERNDGENKGIVKKLEAAGGFRVPTTYRTRRTHGIT